MPKISELAATLVTPTSRIPVVPTGSSTTPYATVQQVADFVPVSSAADGYGVVTGCATTAPGGNLSVTVAAGVTQHGTPGTTATVTAQTVTATTAHATLTRFDAVVVSAAGVVSIVAGTAAATPSFPAIPAGSVEVALLYVPPTTTAFTTAANVIDKRVMILTGTWINVKDYGARGDVRRYTDGAITTGTATFTSATATFTLQDVGKTITVAGAGAAGAMLVTTISGYTNATTVTLAANAGTTVSGKVFGFGTDDSAASTAAINAANALPNGGVVYYPPGIYGHASEIVHKLNVVIKGAGMDVSTVYQLGNAFTLFQEPNIGTPVNTFQGMEDITLWGPMDRDVTQDVGAGTLGAGNRLSLLRAERVWWRRVHAIYSRQMSLTGVGGNECRAEYCTVEKGGRDGINATGSGSFVAVGNTLQELPDDGIAYHISAGFAAGTIVQFRCAILGNLFYKSSGIKILGATNCTISGNSGRFLPGYGVYLDYDATYGEGNKDALGVSITGNSFVDIINLGILTAGAQQNGSAMYIASPVPSQGAALGRIVSNGTTTAASANLTSATIAWTSADIGRAVTVTGAGVAGATLSTRIMSITSGTVAVMETAASTSVAGTATISLSLLAYYPAMTTPGTGTVAVRGPGTNAWNGISAAATGAHGLVIANNTCINTLDGRKQDGTAATTFADYGFGNLWWTAGPVNPAFVSNVPTTGTATYVYNGLFLKDGALRDVSVTGNLFYGHTNSIDLGGTKFNWAGRFFNNTFQRCNRGIQITDNAVADVEFWVKDNLFDLDPIFESTERTIVSTQPTGTWTRASGSTACGLYTWKTYGVHLEGNIFKNLCNITTGNTEGVTWSDNILVLDTTVTSPSMGGVGIVSPADNYILVQSRVIQQISDPRLTTYRSLPSNDDLAGTAAPSTGTWTVGTFIRNSTPTATGRAVIHGWLRMTNGTANVYGTDWVELSSTGGTRSNSSTVGQGAGFATDTYLTGSSVAVPTGLPLVGTRYHLKFDVSKTAAGTAAPVLSIRFGTAGTTADTAIITFTWGAGTTAADVGIVDVEVYFRTVGAGTAAVAVGMASLTSNLTTTGLSNAVKALAVVSAGFNSTVANSIIGASWNGGASAAHTVTAQFAELLPA